MVFWLSTWYRIRPAKLLLNEWQGYQAEDCHRMGSSTGSFGSPRVEDSGQFFTHQKSSQKWFNHYLAFISMHLLLQVQCLCNYYWQWYSNKILMMEDVTNPVFWTACLGFCTATNKAFSISSHMEHRESHLTNKQLVLLNWTRIWEVSFSLFLPLGLILFYFLFGRGWFCWAYSVTVEIFFINWGETHQNFQVHLPFC